ncbi:MAG: hypothetical protein HN633_16580 [Candidatus Marinimicrobia bacterium]|jgi:hypothetical protein|nr:hypothetical protein [Candidatus Neomarinimicrobiota bacterium]MBT7199595.1 hypothetical protein [Candidatus Neomarinimicrobiota bacterium]MBT7580382.1 hypothetical protein [Candidatus Neomarinimicrobiota bacterium]MBT7830450.1 hypothetical protein [Candidatus Neomarinimicrobiota bacterium]
MTKKLEDYKVGDDIYLHSHCYISRGEDDFEGGLCQIVEIKHGKTPDKTMIRVAEQPRTFSNLSMLIKHQEKLKQKYGDRRGYMDPDLDSPPVPEPW